MSECKIRVWLASLAMGLLTSLIFTAAVLRVGIAFWCPPSWPGLFLAFAGGLIGYGQPWNSHTGVALIIVGNTAFYAWIFLTALRAEVAARGSLSRYFLR